MFALKSPLIETVASLILATAEKKPSSLALPEMPTSPNSSLPQGPQSSSAAPPSGLSPALSQEAARAPMRAGASRDTRPIAFFRMDKSSFVYRSISRVTHYEFNVTPAFDGSLEPAIHGERPFYTALRLLSA